MNNTKRALDFGLYSTWNLPATVPLGTYSLFATSVGNIGQGFAIPLTYAETNLEGSGGQLPSEVDQFVFYGLCFFLGSGNRFTAAIPTADDADVHNDLIENAFLRFNSGGTIIPFGPPKFFPAGGGLKHNSYWTTLAAGAALTVSSNNNGIPSAKAILAWKEPIILMGGQSFAIEYIKTGAAAVNAAAYRITVRLLGHSVTRVNN